MFVNALASSVTSTRIPSAFHPNSDLSAAMPRGLDGLTFAGRLQELLEKLKLEDERLLISRQTPGDTEEHIRVAEQQAARDRTLAQPENSSSGNDFAGVLDVLA